MTLTYKLNENDFLQHQLFIASKTDRIKQQRTRTWLIYSASLLLLSLMFYQSGNKIMTYYFLVFGLAFLCLFPLYQKRYYKNHYQKFIAETYKNQFEQIANIEFAEDAIKTNDITGESRINLTEIENITETSGYFYLKMKTVVHLIIPKAAIEDVDNLRKELRNLCGKMTISFINDLTWKWK